MRLRPALEGCELVWVTQPSRRADDLLKSGEQLILLPEYSRNPREARTLTAIGRSIAACTGPDRPRIVVTSGSGLVVPFCTLARLSGAHVIFIETSARVRDPSQAGRVLSRIAHRTIVQWEPMLEVYPRARLAQPSVLSRVRVEPLSDGDGTFVGVGTHIYPFDRLLKMVDEAVGQGLLPRPITAQSGVSEYRPKAFEMRPWLELNEVEDAVERARFVVTHAGSGLISTAISAGRRPMVLPRRADLHEHFDDHQEQLVGELGRLDLVVPLEDEITDVHLAQALRALPDLVAETSVPPLIDVLADELQAAIRRAAVAQ